jgi:WD40 repeat protein
VRVWAWTIASHSLKFECQALGADVEDVAWDSESKRILAVGGGATNAKVFAWDTGSNLAEVVPHSKKVITCDIRPKLPAKLAYGGEDFKMSFYAGPPFKFAATLKEHTNFVNCVRYKPDGSCFASFSSDKSCVLYDGETAAVLGKLDAVHGGGVYAGAWSPDGARLATACGDKTVRVFDMSAGAGGPWPLLGAFALGARPEDMQHAIAWPSAGVLVSTSLEGTLNVFDAANVGAGPVSRVYGHREAASHIARDAATGALFTGCAGGRVCRWAPLDAERSRFAAALATGELPTKKVAALDVRDGLLAVAAWDDKLRTGDAGTGALTTSTPLGAQPKGLVILPDGSVLVATGAALLIVGRGGAVAHTLPAPWGPTCVDASADGSVIAVGGADKRVHLFSRGAGGGGGGALAEAGVTKEANAAVSVVAVEPCGERVAAGDAGREIRLYKAASAETLVSGRWMAHTTRVTGLKWSPSGAWIASVSSDRRLAVWDAAADSPKLTIDLAHAQPFAAVVWAGESEIWTLGTDGVATKRALAL